MCRVTHNKMDDCDNDDDRDGDVDAIHLIISKEGVVKENLIDVVIQ